MTMTMTRAYAARCMTTTPPTTVGRRKSSSNSGRWCEPSRGRMRTRRELTVSALTRRLADVRAMASSSIDGDAEGDEGMKTLVIIECDGALVDVHGDGHRVAFNRAFRARGAVNASWDHREYASLLRSGGGNAYGMLERYFHFYGYPTEVVGASKRIETDEYLQALKRLESVVPLASAGRDAEEEEEGALTSEEQLRAKEVFINGLIEEKEKQFQMMIDEGALKLRPGVERFIDDCLVENDKLRVLLIAETASTAEERVLEAAIAGLGPLRTAAISITGAPESFNDTAGIASQARKEAAQMMKKAKGDLLAPEVGGDLQRQSFNSDVIIDSGVFSTSRRSMLTAEVISQIAMKRGFTSDNVVFIGGAQSTCSEATAAGAFSVMVRNRLQQGGEFPGVDSVVDGYGPGEGITLRRILAVLESRKANK